MIEADSSTTSSTAIIKLIYEGDGANGQAASFFFKFCRTDDRFVVDSEYLYYNRDYTALDNSPIPRCYDASFSPEDASYHLLLQDLSRTHYSNRGIRPSLEHALDVATELARLHAFRWGGKANGVLGDVDLRTQIPRFIHATSKGLAPVLKAIESDVPSEWIATIQKVFETHPYLMQARAEVPAGQTLIHGDANPSNVLSPHDPSGKTYIIDRQPFDWSLRYWLGVYDIVYLAVPYWDVEDRRRLERPLLEMYPTMPLSMKCRW